MMKYADDMNGYDYNKLQHQKKRFRDLENESLFVKNGVRFIKGAPVWNKNWGKCVDIRGVWGAVWVHNLELFSKLLRND